MTVSGFLKVNDYGLNPSYAETITTSIVGDELGDIEVELSTDIGVTMGRVDEYDRRFPIRDTILIELEGRLLGKLVINGTELSITPKYSIAPKEFIQVSFITDGRHPLVKYFLNGKCWEGANWVGDKSYKFLVIHDSDLEQAKTIILNKLKEGITRAKNSFTLEKQEYLNTIKDTYSIYLGTK